MICTSTHSYKNQTHGPLMFIFNNRSKVGGQSKQFSVLSSWLTFCFILGIPNADSVLLDSQMDIWAAIKSCLRSVTEVKSHKSGKSHEIWLEPCQPAAVIIFWCKSTFWGWVACREDAQDRSGVSAGDVLHHGPEENVEKKKKTCILKGI